MERVGTLIHKLQEQFDQQADAEKLAVTAQLLLAELQHFSSQQKVGTNVSVVLPSVSSLSQPVNMPEEKKQATTTVVSNWLFEMAPEAPTITHQHFTDPVHHSSPPKKEKAPLPEFNTLFAKASESLNEKLKEEKVEVAVALQTAPIRDLKKAIGINDRFLFVNELFRGDENMYERSIKTINAFSIYPEAEYWIQRELKVKLSWPDNSETVKLFDQLVRRRFA